MFVQPIAALVVMVMMLVTSVMVVLATMIMMILFNVLIETVAPTAMVMVMSVLNSKQEQEPL